MKTRSKLATKAAAAVRRCGQGDGPVRALDVHLGGPRSGSQARGLRRAALLGLTMVLAAGCGEPAAPVSVGTDAELTAEEPQVPDEIGHTPGETPDALRSRARELLGPGRYGGFWAEDGTLVVTFVDEVSDAERDQLRQVADGRRLRLELVTYPLAELERLAGELEEHLDLGELSLSIHEPDNVVVAQAQDVERAATLLEPWGDAPVRVAEIPVGIAPVGREPPAEP